MRDDETGGSSGLELIGGGLFLAGCLPAAAVARALASGTDLGAPGLGKAAKLAAVVADWVGAWPGLVTSGLIAAVGALMVVGTIRREPLRSILGAVVSGFGLAAVASGLAEGAGGQIGAGVSGLAGSAVSVLVGLAVIGASVWLAAFAPSDADDVAAEDTAPPMPRTGREEPDSIVLGLVSGLVEKTQAGVGAVRERAAARKASRPKESAAPRAAREPRRIQTRRKKRTSAPATLGDAFARDDSEGVSHDEAAALAPDAKALAYMENVWRNAAESFRQAEPLPPSPYPEDVRLRGGIPEGAAPLPLGSEEEAGEAEAPADAPGAEPPARRSDPSRAEPTATAPEDAPDAADPDVAPFDFTDDFGAQAPLSGDDAPGGADDPFAGSLGEATALHPAEAAALEPTLRREAPERAAGELPEGVRYLEDPYAAAFEAPEAPVDGAEVAGGAQPVEPTVPPAPSWEVGYDEEEYDYGDAALGEPEVSVEADLEPDLEPGTEVGLTHASARDAGAGEALDSLALAPESTEEPVEDALGDETDEPAAAPDAPIAEVDPATGRWPRRAGETADDDAAEVADAIDGGDDVLAAEPSEIESPEADLDMFADSEPRTERAAEPSEPAAAPPSHEAPIDSEPEKAAESEPAAEIEADAEADEDVEYEYVDEDGNPIDPAELAEGDWEEVEEADESEDDGDEAELEDDEEAVDYEYVDEDGNPIDASELEDGEWEEVEEDEEDDDVAAEAEEADAEDAATEDTEPEASDDDEEWEEAELDEPEVVLEPQPAPASSANATAEDARLLEAGLLLVREGRVAVSLLQKNLDVEFDEACELLDELQSAGLIGPYRNGKPRDILMDADQWESRFARA